VAEATAVPEVNPFQQSRLLTTERTPLFTRTAEALAERLEEELARWLSDSTVKLETPEQVMIPDLAGPDTDIAIIKSSYHLSHGIIATELELALPIVATLCGGTAQPAQDVRPLSRLETGLLDLILQPVIDLVVELFLVGPSDLGIHVVNASGLPDSQPEPAISIPLQISVGAIEGRIVVGLTAGQLQTYIEDLDRRIAGRLATKKGEPNAQVVRAVPSIPVDLVVGFALTQIPAGHLAGLQVDDVLLTNHVVSRHLVARIGPERIFNVRAAQRGQRLVAEIVDQATAERESQ